MHAKDPETDNELNLPITSDEILACQKKTLKLKTSESEVQMTTLLTK